MNGFWMGHRLLGDVLGFCAAAHLYADKIGQPVKVWFDPDRVDASAFFDGVVWTPKEEIPLAMDCGGTPTPAEWPSLNGVKRFYRFMDPALQPAKTFDIHFNRGRRPNGAGEKLIGLITHSHSQGDIEEETLAEMLDEARRLFPDHRIVSFGRLDNPPPPPGVEDWRRSTIDIGWIIEFVERLALLITPHSGPCYVAAGWQTPMWVYRSMEPWWDWTLSFETYRVQRWWDRKPKSPFAVFDRIYRQGGWDGRGSGPGSAPEVNRELIGLLNQLINRTPGITTVLDIGCGDWQWMRRVDLAGKRYLGVDVASSVIEANLRTFGRDHVRFQTLDACEEDLPEADLIIMKDVVQHLPDECVQTILDRIARRCRWALITHDHAEQNTGQDIQIGGWRPINVLAPPFNFPGVTLGIWNGKHITLSSFMY
jgi:SAM-dependent methyltransferase